MPTFKVNGVTASTTEGAVTVVAKNSFTLSWSGLDSATNYSVKFNIQATNNGSYMDLTNSAGTDIFLYYYTTPEYASDWMTYKAIGTSGSDTITSDVSLAGAKLQIDYITTFDSATYYVTFASPSVTAPGTPTITQNNDGTFKASWSASTGSNGSGSVTYQLWNVTDGIAVSSSSTSTNVNLDIPIYGTAIQYKVIATYSGKTANSSTVTKTFTKPALSAPTNVKLSAATGESTTISWTASSITATTGTITYSIRKNGTQIATTTKTSYTFNKDVTSTWGTSAVTLTVVATASTVNKHYPSLTSSASSGVTFTYKKAQATITYYNGSSWVNCYVYYYDGSNWIAVNPYYYIDNLWKSCSTT